MAREREMWRDLIKKEIYAKRHFQDFYVAICGGQDQKILPQEKKNLSKVFVLYLHSIQLVIPKTKIISLCFISLVVLRFAVNISAAEKREKEKRCKKITRISRDVAKYKIQLP